MIAFSAVLSVLTTTLICYFSGAFNSALTALLALPLCFALWLAYLLLIILILYIQSLFLPKTSPDMPKKYPFFVVSFVIKFLNQFFRIKVQTNGKNLVSNVPTLFVFNHRSIFDPIIVAKQFEEFKPVMISKPENFSIPIAGKFINRAGYLAIDRENDRQALKTILKAITFMKNGISIGVCPEGTRNKTSRDLLPLKAGALKIATKSGCNIAVITLENTQNVVKNFFAFKRTKVYLDVLKIYTKADYSNMSAVELSDEIARIMQQNIDDYKVKL